MNTSMSHDGYIAGPDQSVENPLGVGGMQLHEWVVPLKAFRELHGKEGGEIDDSTPIAETDMTRVGSSARRYHD